MSFAAALPLLSIGATVLGGVMQGVQQRNDGIAAKNQALYEAQVHRNNQIIAERAAADSTARGKFAAQQQRLRTRQLIGRQRAVLAGNGVLVDQGSASDIVTDTARAGELDALMLISNADREAYGYRAQASGSQAQVGLANYRADVARQGTSWGSTLFRTALNTGGSVASKWYSFNDQGIDPLASVRDWWGSSSPQYPVSPATKTGGAF